MMVLGTVELGLDYGINNNRGKPSYRQAFELLDAAWNNHITEIDTAAAYGDSEEIIGKYQEKTNHKYLIDTKLPLSIQDGKYDESLEESCRKLKTDAINLLYLHSFEQCKDEELLDFLQKKRASGIIKHIGISIYEPNELKYIIDNLKFVDTVQFPFNILDNHRWLDDGLLKKAKKNNISLYVRSVFLQGLMFKSVSDPFVKSINAERYIESIRCITEECNFTIAEVAFKYVTQIPEIDEIIVGCQSKDDVLMNVSVMNSSKEINMGFMKRIEELSIDIPAQIIDPRKWRQV